MNRQEKICIVAMHSIDNLIRAGMLASVSGRPLLTAKGRRLYDKIKGSGFTCSQDDLNQVCGELMDEGVIRLAFPSQGVN